jgi:hypothetical protein
MLVPMSDPWWGSFEVGLGTAARWRVGPLILTVTHLRNEWRVCRGSSDDADDRAREVEVGLVPSNPAPGDLVTRYAATDGVDAILLTPVLPDRPVVTRPEQALIVPGRGSGSMFVGSPLFLRLEEAEGPILLEELPAFRPKLTWWGPSAREGATCYASRTAGRLRLEDVVNHPHRVVTEVKIVNRATSPLKVERLNLPVRRLSVYADQDGELWTESVTLERSEGEEYAELHLGARPPAEELLAPPRDTSGLALFRAFGSLFQ